VKHLNPLGQLPVLEIDGERVADSTRILHRIEQLAPGALTSGLDARGTAEAWLWEEFSDAALYPQVLAMRWADDRGWEMVRKEFFGALPPLLRDVIGALVRRRVQKDLIARDFLRAGLPACTERLQTMLDALDARAPEDGFWVGSAPSVADLGLFAQLHSLCLPQTPWLAETVAQRKRLARWLDRVDVATRAA
jgi:glutathione S-transferase